MPSMQQIDDKPQLFALLRILWGHISPRRRMQLGGLAALMLLGTMMELFSLGMVLPFLGVLTAPDHVFGHPMAQPVITYFGLTSPQQLLLPLTVLFALAAVLSGATRLALLWGQTRLGNAIGHDLGVAAYRRTLYQPYVIHALRNSSEIIAALMNKSHTIVYSIVIPVLTLATSAFMVFTIAAFMLMVDPKLTMMAFFGFGFLYLLVAYSTKQRLIRDSQRVNEGQSNVTRVVQEGLGGIRDVLIDGVQETYVRLYRQVDGQLRRALVSIHVIGGMPRPVIEAFGLALIGVLAYTLASTPDGMSNALPMLGALALAAQRLLPMVQSGYSSWAYILSGQDSLRDVLKLLEQPLPAYSTLPPPAPIPFEREISLIDLKFQYTLQGPWVLRGIDLRIQRGSRVGFIGSSGSGKSTLLDIVMGLLTPTSGAIRIDDAVVDENNRRAWQAHIAHVPQTIYLIDATIAENIAFGVRREDIDLARVREAAMRAQIAGTIESWQDAYDTVVGERGVRLSGGQRQRIGIARALYKRVDVIVFDEATSALDSETERMVMASIEALGRDLTILIVAHRVTTLNNCDQIVELNDGAVQRIGDYEDIIGLPAAAT
jgi:ATP-binding cassette, subfamily B, bacterial PglK